MKSHFLQKAKILNGESCLFWHVGRPLVTDSGHDAHDHLGPVAVHLVAEDGAKQVGQVHQRKVAARRGRLHRDEGGRAATRARHDGRVNVDARYAREISLLHPIFAVEGAIEDGLEWSSCP